MYQHQTDTENVSIVVFTIFLHTCRPHQETSLGSLMSPRPGRVWPRSCCRNAEVNLHWVIAARLVRRSAPAAGTRRTVVCTNHPSCGVISEISQSESSVTPSSVWRTGTHYYWAVIFEARAHPNLTLTLTKRPKLRNSWRRCLRS